MQARVEKIYQRLERWPVFVGFVLDPDCYLIEIIQHDGKRPGE